MLQMLQLYQYMKKNKTHINGKPIKMAKCGKHSLYFCKLEYHDCEDCKKCNLVPHRFYKLYKIIDGVKHKRCSKCGEYKTINCFVLRKNGYLSSWCNKCVTNWKKQKIN